MTPWQRPQEKGIDLAIALDMSPKRLEGFHFTHQVTPAVFALVRDDTNYTVPEERWAPPSLPSALADVERE